jgi:hypothetical protein
MTDFLSPALVVLSCTLSHIPADHTWVGKCTEDTGRQFYIASHETLRAEKREAKKILNAHRPKNYTVAVEDLRHGK